MSPPSRPKVEYRRAQDEGGMHGLGLNVDDCQKTYEELSAKGVEFVAETWDSGVCHFAAFLDPDGNTLILHRRYAPWREPAEDS